MENVNANPAAAAANASTTAAAGTNPEVAAAAAAGANAEAPADQGTQLSQLIDKMLAELEGKTEDEKGAEEKEAEPAAITPDKIAEMIAAAVGKMTAAEGDDKGKKGEKAPTLEEKVAQLEAQVQEKDLRNEAREALEKEGYPTALANLLRYESPEAMKQSLEAVKGIFAASLGEAIKDKLKGKTPAGIGGARSQVGDGKTATQRAAALNAHRIVK